LPATQPWLASTNWMAWSDGVAAPSAEPPAGPRSAVTDAPVLAQFALVGDDDGAGPPEAACVPPVALAERAAAGVLAGMGLLAGWRGGGSLANLTAPQPPRRPAAASAATAGRTARARGRQRPARRSGRELPVGSPVALFVSMSCISFLG
jgi:hypothetical protein